jgi:hypothetical protein
LLDEAVKFGQYRIPCEQIAECEDQKIRWLM